MAWIDGPRIRPASIALLAFGLLVTGAEARGFGGGFRGAGVAPRVGAWGRPLGPVRPGVAPPGLAFRYPRYHRHWHHGPWYGYGLGGAGLGLLLGGWLWDREDPWFYDDTVYAPPVHVPPAEVTVETDVVTDKSAAVAACARRFRTYDPTTRTYVGKGYVRRSCP